MSKHIHVKTAVLFSWGIVIGSYIFGAILGIICVYFAYIENIYVSDCVSVLSAWLILCGTDTVGASTITAFYVWKAKHEQKHQDIQQLFNDIPQAYIDENKIDVTSVVTTFLND